MSFPYGRGGPFRWACAVVVVANGLSLAACAQARPTEPSATASGSAPIAAPKTLIVGMTAAKEPKDSIISFQAPGAAGSGFPEYAFSFHAGLTVYDPQSKVLPRVAQRVPTTENGDWQVFPDGRMDVTWRIRPDARWHDGAAATSEDFAFGLQVLQNPESPLIRNDPARLISEIVTPDPSTLVVRWKQIYIFANASGPTDLPALPVHLMGPAYEKGDSQAFFNSSMWRTDFIGLGPYRLHEWIEGTRIEGLAFDDYFLGRPRIDRIIFRYVGDSNALLLNLLSGAVDMTLTGNFAIPDLVLLKNVWEPAGAGTGFPIVSRTRTYNFQFRDPDAPWARDVRVRRALAHMLDRQSLADALMGGLVTPADTLVAPGDPVFRLLEQREFSRYPFDLSQAERLLADAGWTRPTGGSYRSAAGNPLTLDVTFSDVPANKKEAEALGGQWKAAGLADVTFTPRPNTAPTAVQNELRNTFRGVASEPIGGDLLGMAAFITPQIGTPENRYATSNRNGYSNAEFDRLFERANVTLDLGQRQGMMADMLRLLADEEIVIPVFYDSSFATGAYRKGVRGPAPTSPMQLVVISWNIHEWDVD